MDKEKMIKAALYIKTVCSSLECDDCCNKKVECPFQRQQLKGDKYVCCLKAFVKFPCDWEVPLTLDEWISRFDNKDADTLSQLEQIQIEEMLVELKIRREREGK